jgi:hypothetical protein
MSIRSQTAIFVAALCVGSMLGRPTPVEAAAKGCDNIRTLALTRLSDAVTSGDDRGVLSSSLEEADRLRACGFLDDAISFELIAADAYGDINETAKRCDLLTTIYDELKKRGEARAERVHSALASCGVGR